MVYINSHRPVFNIIILHHTSYPLPKIMCHELGCLPVSKLCGLPSPSDLLESDGTPKDANHRMLQQLPELLTQLEWMAVAMKNQRCVWCLFVSLGLSWFESSPTHHHLRNMEHVQGKDWHLLKGCGVCRERESTETMKFSIEC
jgi:hypothetical protein